MECSSSPTSGTRFSLVGGFIALTCVQSVRLGASDAMGAGFGLAAAELMQVCGVAGSSPWLVRLPRAELGVMWFLVPVLLDGPVLAYTYSCVGVFIAA